MEFRNRILLLLFCACMSTWVCASTPPLLAAPAATDAQAAGQNSSVATNMPDISENLLAHKSVATATPAQAGAAQDVPSRPTPYKIAPLDTSTALLKTFGGLAVIVVLIFACAKATKLLAGPLRNQKPVLQLLASLPLGSKEKIALIEVGGKQVLIGITAQHISRLMELDEPVKIIQPAEVNGSLSAKTANEFSKKLNEFLSAGNRQP